MRVPENAIFILMDIKTLYTNMPRDEGIDTYKGYKS